MRQCWSPLPNLLQEATLLFFLSIRSKNFQATTQISKPNSYPCIPLTPVARCMRQVSTPPIALRSNPSNPGPASCWCESPFKYFMRHLYASSMHRYHLVQTLRLTDPLPTDACSLKVSANLITAAAAWVKADRPRQIAFVLEHQCDDKTYGSTSFGMLKGRDAALAQLLRGVCDGAGQASCSSLFFFFCLAFFCSSHSLAAGSLRGSPVLRLQRYLPDTAQALGQEAGAQKTWSINFRLQRRQCLRVFQWRAE